MIGLHVEALLELFHLFKWIDLQVAIAVDDSTMALILGLLRLVSPLKRRKSDFNRVLIVEARRYLKLGLEDRIHIELVAA